MCKSNLWWFIHIINGSCMIYVIYVHGWHIKMDHLRFHLPRCNACWIEEQILRCRSWPLDHGANLWWFFPWKTVGNLWESHGKPMENHPEYRTKTGNLVLLCSTSDLKPDLGRWWLCGLLTDMDLRTSGVQQSAKQPQHSQLRLPFA